MGTPELTLVLQYLSSEKISYTYAHEVFPDQSQLLWEVIEGSHPRALIKSALITRPLRSFFEAQRLNSLPCRPSIFSLCRKEERTRRRVKICCLLATSAPSRVQQSPSRQ